MVETLETRTRHWCLLAAGASALPLLLQVPQWLAITLMSTFTLSAFSKKPWPAALRLLLTVMIGGLVLAAYGFGIGRDTASAGLLAMLMLKPLETFSPRDARSLLGFSLFAPFAAFLQEQGPLTLALALPAALLSVASWSRLVQSKPMPMLPLLRRAVVALVIATPMALTGFWLFPRLATPLWGLPDTAAGTMGLGDRMTPSDWLDVLVDDSAAFRVRFIGATPKREQMYWRGPVLTRFDGESWLRDPSAGGMPAPLRQATGKRITYEVMLEPTRRNDLPMLDLALNAPANAKLNGEMTAVNSDVINNLMRYQGQSVVTARIIEPLSPSLHRAMLSLPVNRDLRTLQQARQWQQETPNPLVLTQRFLNWIKRDFKYTISAPPVGFNATDDFLFNTQLGFCQHFSSAYVVFMRAAGVPSRVVTGYVGGHYNKVGQYWLLKHKDAHAWAEIWIEGQGWLRVDPTAAIAPENILDTLDDLQLRQQGLTGLAGITDTAGRMLQPMFDVGDFARRQWNELVLGFDAARQKGLLKPLGIDDAEAWQLVTAFAVGSGLALALTLLFLLRERRSQAEPLERAWQQFVRRLGKFGFAKHSHEPPLSYARRLSTELPEQASLLISLSQRYSNWRYAANGFSDKEKLQLIREFQNFRPARRPRPIL